MTAEREKMSLEEMVDSFDEGEDLVDYEQGLMVMDSASGPMEASSVRLPSVLLRAIDNIDSKNADRSSIIRAAIYRWLQDNNPEALLEAQREIESELEQSQQSKKASA